ncbi:MULTISPECIES: hypothetical protein [unclassified Rhizobium]|uniref:hypothetical protein n=1 Tax=unclassified Rhizobium TaxID=2613769 RepID=UPI000EA84129|nr:MULTISPECIES: hypothetical protein [unclassified Rhizobium]AYG69218.1 hypothetical protein CCGE531_24590 [Rhizobium sp. CCGE531]AYG75598.1 hypothetical protein CCGE532_24095 [Rhizobium sp. CCGE532]
MIRHNLSQWPLVLSAARGSMSPEELYGVPAQIFDEVNEATMWPASVSAVRGKPVNMGHVLRSLTDLCRPS